MKRHKRLRTRGHLPLVDADFVEQLAGGRSHPSGRSRHHTDHKTLQLCRQVERALALSLSGECDDDVLRSIYVEEVVPAPNTSRLLVRLIVPASAGATPMEVLSRLQPLAARLRAEVARAITRKRAPELSFLPVADSTVPGPGEVTP